MTAQKESRSEVSQPTIFEGRGKLLVLGIQNSRHWLGPHAPNDEWDKLTGHFTWVNAVFCGKTKMYCWKLWDISGEKKLVACIVSFMEGTWTIIPFSM